MSTIVCAISGQHPEEPVFSPKTGHVYERRLITKHVDSAGKCPVTDEEITQEDLVDIRLNKGVRPKPATATSIPGMLTLLQSEWDALMSEMFDLKTTLERTRKQLSHALYQHDGACRVVARLLRERDASRAQVRELQDQLANSQPMAQGAAGGAQGNDAEVGLTPEILERFTQCAQSLTKTRKKKEFPGLAPVVDVKKLAVAGSFPTHQSTAPGITCVDVHKTDDAKVVTGGIDTHVVLFDAQQQKTVQKLIGHRKKVTKVLLHPTQNVVVSASDDATARVWSCTNSSDWRSEYTTSHVFRKHRAEVTGLSLHPLGDYLLTCSRDKSWAFHEMVEGRTIRHVKDLDHGYLCMQWHPDGLILAGGAEDKTVNVWDVKSQKVVASLAGHEDLVDTLNFSENGYYLASGSRDGAVKIWDLRKPLNIQTLKVAGPVNCVRFDQTGQYLAAASDNVSVFNFATKSSLAETCQLSDHSAPVMGACFGAHARSLMTVSMDRAMKLYSIR